ncbi:hypothetical protein F4778DRAFT_181382 [Xylariomycetidae sp. FL2044]|nr:hypothetical protein F4778DRAFT_181382 [Xylariomycetidae sp. FL2044]
MATHTDQSYPQVVQPDLEVANPEPQPASGLIVTSPAPSGSIVHSTVETKPRYTESGEQPTSPASRRSWLLPASIAALVTALVIGGAIGGGLGASLSSCRLSETQQQSTTATPTATTTQPPVSSGTVLVDYQAAAATTVANVSVDCDSLSKNTQTTQFGEEYSVYCQKDIQFGPKTDSSNNQVILGDLTCLLAYSFQDCILACNVYNRKSTEFARAGDRCGTVLFRSDMNQSATTDGGNCWLKNATVSPADNTAVDCDACITAVRVV